MTHRFARNAEAELPGFDGERYGIEGRFRDRPLASVLDELQLLRRSTVLFFQNLPPKIPLRAGVAGRCRMSVLGLGYVVAGHELHHRAILTRRYL